MSGDNFYKGADYGFDPKYGGTSQTYSANYSANLGLSTDPRIANQLKAVSEKLNTGATTVEVSLVTPDVFESIPKQHFEELNRLRKLVGGNVELTLHAPVIEPTGLSKRGWDPNDREQAERQMTDAIMKAHELNPKGNVVTTFHASAIGLPAEVKVWEGEGEKKHAVVKEVIVIDEKSGGIQNLPLKPSAFEGFAQVKAEEEIKKFNNSNWYKTLQQINFRVGEGLNIVEGSFAIPEAQAGKLKEGKILELYKDYAEGRSDKVEKVLEGVAPELKEIYQHKMHSISRGDIYLRDSYNGLKEMFDQAYHALQRTDTAKAKEDLEKLDAYRKKIAPKLNYLAKPEGVKELAESLKDGVHLLRSIEAPQIFKPFKDFALEKSAETFGNVAFSAFKKFGDNSPIVSIENPPAGQGILHTGEDLKRLVEKSRSQFERQAVEKLNLSETEAKKQAEKIIGVTWDVGHINMLRKFGAGTEELKAETEKIAKLAKHVHLSDNFGMEHTELPMGMGNVPKEMLELIEKNNKKFKKIVEVGNWYQHFQTTPFPETLQHFNSPIYAMKSASYWGPQGYFAGFGNNPDIHHALYGAGFANLPVELGGQMSGKSRVSGNPLE